MRFRIAEIFKELGLPAFAPSYKELYVLMFLVALVFAAILAKKRGLPPHRFYMATLITAALALLGSRLFYLLTHLSASSGLGVWALLTGDGTSSFGAYVLGISGAVCCLRLLRIDTLRGLDVFAPVMAVALIIGRLGCLSSGCCFGKPSALPWAVSFPAGSPAYLAQASSGLIAADSASSLPVHPVQVYEIIFGLAALLVLLSKRARQTRNGLLFFRYIVAYALFRCFLELFRDDPGATLLRPSIGQVLWFGASIAALTMAFRIAHKGNEETIGCMQTN